MTWIWRAIKIVWEIVKSIFRSNPTKNISIEHPVDYDFNDSTTKSDDEIISRLYENINAPGPEEVNCVKYVRKEIDAAGITLFPTKVIGGFSKKELLKMAYLSKRSYVIDNSEDLSDYICDDQTLIDEGYIIQVVQSKTWGLRAVILFKDNEIIVSFRGTKNRYNVIADMNFMLATSGFMEGRVHSGIYLSFRNIWPHVRSVIDEILITHNKVEKDMVYKLTGHSMGGGIAKIVALYINKEWGIEPKNIKVATFGDPRVFDTRQANIYSNLGLGDNTVRVVQHFRDPIPAIAPGSFGYKHVGMQIRVPLTEEGIYHRMDGYNLGIQKLDEYIDNKSVSFFHYPSQLLQALNEQLIGTAQHFLKTKRIKTPWHIQERELRQKDIETLRSKLEANNLSDTPLRSDEVLTAKGKYVDKSRTNSGTQFSK